MDNKTTHEQIQDNLVEINAQLLHVIELYKLLNRAKMLNEEVTRMEGVE